MTEALKQTGLPGFLSPKNAAKHGKRADPAAFGDALRSVGAKGKTVDKTPPDVLQRATPSVAIIASAKPATAEKLVRNDDETTENHDEPKLEREEKQSDETDIVEATVPVAVAVAADVVVQFTAALDVLRQGSTEDERQEPETARKAEVASEPKTDPVEKKDDLNAKAVEVEPTDSAETAEQVATKAPVASVAGDAAIKIEGVKVIAVQVQTTAAAPVAAAAQLIVPAQLAAKDTSKNDDTMKPADTRPTAVETTSTAKVVAPNEPSTGGQMDQNLDEGRDAAPESRRVEAPAAQSRSSIFVEQTASPAAPVAPSVNASVVANAIAGVEGLRPSTETVAQMLLRLSSSQGGQVQSLKIQLHPAELGVVTAQLNFAGDQLSVELKVENSEAYHRLSMDTETIAKSLRSLGFDVDQVSVQQPQLVAAATARADIGGDSSGNFSRENSSFQSWGSSNGDDRTGGQAAGRGRENGGGRHEANAPVRQNNTGSDIYI